MDRDVSTFLYFQVAKNATVLKRRKSRQKLDTNLDTMMTEEHFIDNSDKTSVGK